MKIIEVYSYTQWGKISNIDHEKNLRIIWGAYGDLLRFVRENGYPHPVIEKELKGCRLIFTSSDPPHNAFQFLKHKYISQRLDKDLDALQIIESLKEIGEWKE